MKKIIRFTTLATTILFGMMLTSCSDATEDWREDKYINVSPSHLVFPAEGGEKTVTVNSNYRNNSYKIKEIPEWIDIASSKYIDDGVDSILTCQFTIGVKPNDMEKPRSYELIIYVIDEIDGEEVHKYATISVKQEGSDGSVPVVNYLTQAKVYQLRFRFENTENKSINTNGLQLYVSSPDDKNLVKWENSYTDEGDLVIKGEAKYETDQVAINNPKYTLEDKYRLPGEYGKEFYFELTFAFDEDRNTVYIKKGIYRFLWKRNLAIGYKNQTVDDIIAGDFDLGHCWPKETVKDKTKPNSWPIFNYQFPISSFSGVMTFIGFFEGDNHEYIKDEYYVGTGWNISIEASFIKK